MKKRYLIFQGYLGDFTVLLVQAVSIYIFVNNNENYLYASWVLVLAIVNPVIGFSSLSLDSVIATENSVSKIKNYIMFRFRTLVIFLPIVLLINFIYRTNASPWFLLLLVYFLKSFESFSTVFRGTYYRNKEILKASVSKSFAKLGYLFGFGFFLNFLNSLSYAILLIIIWNVLVFILYDLIYNKNFDIFSIKSIKDISRDFSILKEFYLLGVNSFLSLVVISAPQILIERLLGLETLSLIGIVMLFNSALDNFYISSNNTLRKSYLDILENKNQYKMFLRQLLVLFSAFLVSTIAIFYYLGDKLFSIYNQNSESQLIITYLVLIGSFIFYMANAINFQYFIKRDILQLFKFSLLRCSASIFLSYYFVVTLGEIGFGMVYLSSNIIYLAYTLIKTEIFK